MKSDEKTLRFGIMLDAMLLERWQAETVKLLTDNGMTLSLIIKNEEEPKKVGLFKKLRHYPYRRMFFQIWNHYFFKPACKAPVSLSDYCDLANVELMPCVPQHQGIATYLTNHDAEIVRQRQLDFILRFGFNIIMGDILQAARYGVWSFHHDDEQQYRGAPPGFWEFMQDNPVNGVILQRLNESLDKGHILKKAYYPTQLHSYKAHLNQLYFESETLPLQVCREIMQTGSATETESQSKAPLYRAPKNSKMLHYWILCVTRRLRFHLHDSFRQEDWDIAYAHVPLHEFIDDPEAHAKDFKWFRRQNGSTYYADPFVVTTQRDTYIFFERYDYKKGKGDICMALQSESFKKHHLALSEPHHLSYPFVFQHEGNIYCIPEANESNQISLYRFDEQRLRLVKDCVLLDGIRAVDATLLHKDGIWNLFLGLQAYSNSKLYRYLSNDLRGPYEPYYNNPIKTDCQDARMAGAFIADGDTLLRPAQESIRYYGTAVCLNQVSMLDEHAYQETKTSRIAPFGNSRFNKGLHTLNGNEHITVIDGKRFYFTFAGLFHQLKLKFK